MKSMKYRINKSVFSVSAIFAVGLLLFGCQSRPSPDVHYYLLQSSVADSGSEGVEVSNIKLPAYLQGSSLMLSVSEYEIRPARYHLWSEPLEDGIRRVLEAEIAWKLKQSNKELGLVQVDLEVDAFHATEFGRVILKGTWRSGEEGAESRAFSIQLKVEADGYPAAVGAHVRALSSLGAEIAEAL